MIQSGIIRSNYHFRISGLRLWIFNNRKIEIWNYKFINSDWNIPHSYYRDLYKGTSWKKMIRYRGVSKFFQESDNSSGEHSDYAATIDLIPISYISAYHISKYSTVPPWNISSHSSSESIIYATSKSIKAFNFNIKMKQTYSL